MAEVDLGSQVGVGILNEEVFATAVPPISEEEVKILEWAGVIGSPDEVAEVDKSGGIVGIEQPGSSLEEKIVAATRKAVQIARVFNAYKLREEVTIISAQPIDFTGRTG